MMKMKEMKVGQEGVRMGLVLNIQVWVTWSTLGLHLWKIPSHQETEQQTQTLQLWLERFISIKHLLSHSFVLLHWRQIGRGPRPDGSEELKVVVAVGD